MIFGWKTKPEWVAVYEKRAAERAARMEKLMLSKAMDDVLDVYRPSLGIQNLIEETGQIKRS